MKQLVVLVVAAGCAVIAGCGIAAVKPGQAVTVVVTTTVTPTPMDSVSVPSVPSSSAPPKSSKLDDSSPESAAAGYISVARSLDWRWAGPAGYLPRVKQLVVPAFWSTTLAPLASAPGGQSWLDFQAGHGLQATTITSAVVAAGAPRTATGCVVRVAYARTVSGGGNLADQGGSIVQVTENVTMQKTGSRWLVAGTSSEGG
jgi:hypothetical protein